MDKKIIINIKIAVIDNIVAGSLGSHELRDLIKNLFQYYRFSPIYLSRLIKSITKHKIELTKSIIPLLSSKYPSVLKESIYYFASRKDITVIKQIENCIDNHDSDVKEAVIDYIIAIKNRSFYKSLIKRFDSEHDPKVRSKIILLFKGMSFDREIRQFFLKISRTITDERELSSYVNVLSSIGEYHQVIRRFNEFDVIVRIEFYRSLINTSDFRMSEFLWKQFEDEQEIGKLSLYSILPIKTKTQVEQIIRSINSLGNIYYRKVLNIISDRNDTQLISDYINDHIISYIVNRIIISIRDSGDEDFFKTCVRFFRSCRNKAELININLLLEEVKIDKVNKELFLFLIDNPIDIVIERVYSIISEAAFCKDLEINITNIDIEPWIRFVIERKSVDFMLLYCYSLFLDELLKNEIIFYGAREGSELVSKYIIDFINQKKSGISEKAIKNGRLFIKGDLKRSLLYNFSSFDKNSKIEILKIYKDNISENIPLLRTALNDESLEVRKNAIECVNTLKSSQRDEFLSPVVYSECVSTSILAIVSSSVISEEKKEVFFRQILKLDIKRAIPLFDKIVENELGEDFLLIIIFLGASPNNSKVKEKFLEKCKDPENLSLLLKLLNDELFPENVKQFKDMLFVYSINYLLRTENIDKAMEIIISNKEASDISSYILEIFEYVEVEIFKDLLDDTLKQSYTIEFLGNKYNIPIPSSINEKINNYPKNKNELILKIASNSNKSCAYQETINYLNMIDSENTFSDEYNFLLGSSYLRLGHISMALPFLENLDASSGKEVWAYLYETASLLEKSREWRTALHFYRKVASVNIDYGDISEKIVEIEKRIKGFNKIELPFDIDRFQQAEEIGSGGMGKVYKVYDVDKGCQVAIKVLSKEHSDNMMMARRFILRDGFVVQKLEHPGIIKIFDVVKDSVPPYIVMEYLEGKTLKDLIPEYGMLEDEALRIFKRLLDAVAYAHSMGVIHRDLKPENIMVDFKGNVKLMDFGLAKEKGATTMTQAGEMFGTLYYMSPEQLRGEATDERADIYALGVIFYQILSGKLPFSGENPELTMYKIFKEKPLMLSEYDQKFEKWDKIISKVLSKYTNDRFQSVVEFIEELKKIENGVA